MRTYQEVSDTVEQLKHLDEINEFLHNVFDEISLIKKKGELWIEENETSTFTEMKEYITEKTSEILQHTISVASTFIENLVDTAPVSKQVDKDGGVVKPGVCPEENQTSEKINVNKINYLFTSQSTKLKKLQQKVIEQQMINEDLGKKLDTSLHKDEQETPLQLKDLQENLNKQLDRFKEDVMSELHSAGIFITHLQTQWETWLKEQKSNKEINLLQLGLKANDKIVIQGQKNLSTTQEDILKTPDHLAKADTHNDFEKELNEIKDNQSQVLRKVKNVERELMRLSERPELLCQIVSDSDVDCFEGCPHIVGHHEQQISEGGEVNLHEYVKDCKNNAAHTQFIPVKSLRLKHLLKGYHDKDVYNLIKAAAFLTVRISVTMISPHRPDVWPNTEVPCFLFNMIGSQHLRMASGIVKDIIPDDDKSCPCDKCQHSNTPSQKWWRIGVRTAANVVFDDIEAGHSVIRLFYDTEDSPEFLVRSLEEEALVEKNISEDWCTLDYITCDAKLVKRLDRMVDRYNELSGKVTEKYKNCQNQEKLMFLVSHPHGLCKQISIGQWETNSLGIYLKFTYSTYSCPGSAGAIAYFVGKGLRTHSGNMKSGLSYCSG